MKKKRRQEFSDTAVVVLLVAVILVSFIGTLLVYKSVSIYQSRPQTIYSINRDSVQLDGATGMVSVVVIDKDYINPDKESNQT